MTRFYFQIKNLDFQVQASKRCIIACNIFDSAAIEYGEEVELYARSLISRFEWYR